MKKKIIINDTQYKKIGEMTLDLDKYGKCVQKKNIRIADCMKNDDDELEMEIYLPFKKTFDTMNYESCVSPLEQEYSAYKNLKRHYLNGEYYDCSILINNYFGHINYNKEFGYDKSHEEICLILYQNMLASLQKDHKDSFIEFVDNMMGKIMYKKKVWKNMKTK